MPRSRSIAIQSEVTPRRPALPCTAPAWLIADACSASASVSVDLPASGWLITANVRRREASSRTAPSDRGSFSSSVTDTAASLLIRLESQIRNQRKSQSIPPNGRVVSRRTLMAPAKRVRRLCNFPARDRLCAGRERPHYRRLYTLTTPAYGHGSIPTADPRTGVREESRHETQSEPPREAVAQDRRAGRCGRGRGGRPGRGRRR